jgi:hypothetical protein
LNLRGCFSVVTDQALQQLTKSCKRIAVLNIGIFLVGGCIVFCAIETRLTHHRHGACDWAGQPIANT